MFFRFLSLNIYILLYSKYSIYSTSASWIFCIYLHLVLVLVFSVKEVFRILGCNYWLRVFVGFCSACRKRSQKWRNHQTKLWSLPTMFLVMGVVMLLVLRRYDSLCCLFVSGIMDLFYLSFFNFFNSEFWFPVLWLMNEDRFWI